MKRGDKRALVVDGVESDKAYDNFVRGMQPIFDAPGSVHALTESNGEFFYVRVAVQE